MNKPTVGSLFDGIGGFLLSAMHSGMIPIWASEIEPAPMSVTKKHFPKVKQLGDITKINGAEIWPVDTITFGSPCQDLSVAGRRAGMVRKCETCGHVWNYSTTYGIDDFCPECFSPDIESTRSGLFMDAIRVIREMRDETCGIFPRFTCWENVPGALSSNGGADFKTVLEEIAEAEIPMPRSGRWANAGMVRSCRADIAWRILDAQYWGVPQRRKRIFLIADFTGRRAAEILFKPESLPGYFTESERTREGIAGNTQNGAGESSGGFGFPVIANTLLAKSNLTYRMDMDNIVRFQSNASIADSSPILENSAPLRSTSRMAVCFGPNNNRETAHALRSQASKADKSESTTYVVHPSVTGTLCASGAGTNRPAGQGNETDLVICVGVDAFGQYRKFTQCITTKQGSRLDPEPGTFIAVQSATRYRRYRVRRLTPLECERLQGFPDNWTSGLSDTQRYKALGNSIAKPCPDFVLDGIAKVLRGERLA